MEWLNPKETTAENYRLCEIEFDNGFKANGYLSSARGWFNELGGRFSCKFAIKQFRYIEDHPVMPWVRHSKQGGTK
jgi:hypothetical protein